MLLLLHPLMLTSDVCCLPLLINLLLRVAAVVVTLRATQLQLHLLLPTCDGCSLLLLLLNWLLSAAAVLVTL